MKTNKSKHEITEMFMAKADWNRCFYGTIKRNELSVFGKIIVKIGKHDGFVIANACDQESLGSKLDELVTLVLDNGLHDNQLKSLVIDGYINSLN